jgi:multisubunit Na+/H+ antiporter MnhF subunit
VHVVIASFNGLCVIVALVLAVICVVKGRQMDVRVLAWSALLLALALGLGRVSLNLGAG